MSEPYHITLTSEDIKTIGFVGYRYCWSDTLSNLSEGKNELTESEAWEIADAFEEDTEGGHSPFPMLGSGDLKTELLRFWESIV